MGLDTLELVMEIEEAFSIKIPDDEASKLHTVGDVLDFLVNKTSLAQSETTCLSAITFYTLRRAINDLGNGLRLRPRDSTFAILPNSRRPKYWGQLQRKSKLKLPSLCRPTWLVSTCAVLVVACSAYLGFLTYMLTNSQAGGTAAAIAGGILLASDSAALTKPFAIHPASSFRTLRGLAESTLALNFKSLSEQYNGPHENDLWIA